MDSQTLAQITSGRWVNLDGTIELSQASIDSREIKEGQVFIALKTQRDDGHEYVSSAFVKGAAAAVVSHPVQGGPCLVVDDPQQALCQWARYQRENYKGTVIGVVGSVGKTTAKELIAFLISTNHQVCSSPKSFNNHLGVPLTLIQCPEDSDFLVLEMGSNGPGDLDFLGSLAKPDHLFVTPIGEAHLKGFKNVEGVRRAKSEILNHLNPEGWLVWPWDRDLQKAWKWSGQQVTWGDACADIKPYPCFIKFPKTIVSCDDQEIEIQFPALWIGSLLSGIKALLSRLSIAVNWEDLSQFKPPPSRLEVLHVNKLTIINDAWNANPVSVSHSIDMLKQVVNRKVFILGDMLELGETSLYWHRRVGTLCNKSVDILICVGPQAKFAAETFNGQSYVFGTIGHCQRQLSTIIKDGDVVLFKGSRSLNLDKIANQFVPRRVSA